MSWARLSDVVLAYPGYFTGRTALAYWGVSLEFDVPIQVATTVTDAERDGVLYVWMPDDMYFGFVRREGVLIATPEKALVDGFWIEERLGVYPCDPDDVLWEELDPEVLAEILLRVGPDLIERIPPGDVRTAEREVFRRRVARRLRAALGRRPGRHLPPRERDRGGGLPPRTPERRRPHPESG